MPERARKAMLDTLQWLFFPSISDVLDGFRLILLCLAAWGFVLLIKAKIEVLPRYARWVRVNYRLWGKVGLVAVGVVLAFCLVYFVFGYDGRLAKVLFA